MIIKMRKGPMTTFGIAIAVLSIVFFPILTAVGVGIAVGASVEVVLEGDAPK